MILLCPPRGQRATEPYGNWYNHSTVTKQLWLWTVLVLVLYLAFLLLDPLLIFGFWCLLKVSLLCIMYSLKGSISCNLCLFILLLSNSLVFNLINFQLLSYIYTLHLPEKSVQFNTVWNPKERVERGWACSSCLSYQSGIAHDRKQIITPLPTFLFILFTNRRVWFLWLSEIILGCCLLASRSLCGHDGFLHAVPFHQPARLPVPPALKSRTELKLQSGSQLPLFLLYCSAIALRPKELWGRGPVWCLAQFHLLNISMYVYDAI